MNGQTYKTEAHFGLGEHVDLRQLMLDQTLLADSTLYGFTQKAAVAFVKATDDMITDAIIQKAKEHGITDLYVLNEDFIIAAIREKMAREEKFEPARWIYKGRAGDASWEIDGRGNCWTVYECSECGYRLCGAPKTPYCPHCGAKMNTEG